MRPKTVKIVSHPDFGVPGALKLELSESRYVRVAQCCGLVMIESVNGDTKIRFAMSEEAARALQRMLNIEFPPGGYLPGTYDEYRDLSAAYAQAAILR